MGASKDLPLVRAAIIRQLTTCRPTDERFVGRSVTEIAFAAYIKNELAVERILSDLVRDGIATSKKKRERWYCLTKAFASLSEKEFDLLRKYFPNWRTVLKQGPEFTRSYIARAKQEQERRGLDGIVSRWWSGR